MIDDESSVRELVALTLAKCGASVTVAASVKDALGLLPNLTPDVVVSDIAMPDVDGYQFIQRLRTLASPKGANIPAIALTAYAMNGGQDAPGDMVYDGYVSKPVARQELIQTIEEFLKNDETTAADCAAGGGLQNEPSDGVPTSGWHSEIDYRAKILIVDDEPKNVKLFAGILSAENYEVITAYDGEEALLKTYDEKPPRC